MKVRYVLAALLCSAFLLTQGFSADDKEKKEFSAKCVVSGQPAKEDHFVEFKTKKIYFCCDNCPEAFKADRKKFAIKVAHQLMSTEQMIQVACPYSGMPVKDGTQLDIDGVKVGFCCNNCKGKTEKASDKLALVFENLDKGYTLQTECPVSGMPVDITKTLKHDGKTVYFCCENCPKAFEKEPEKFVEKLPQFAKDES